MGKKNPGLLVALGMLAVGLTVIFVLRLLTS